MNLDGRMYELSFYSSLDVPNDIYVLNMELLKQFDGEVFVNRWYIKKYE